MGEQQNGDEQLNENLTYDPTGIALTEAAEGCCLVAYLDSDNVLTIGVGHTGPDVHWGLTITQDHADTLLLLDVKYAEDGVKRLVTVPLTQHQFDALVDFTFNEGVGHLASSTLLKNLNAGDYAGAAEEFAAWCMGGGKVLAGLVTRRGWDRDLFLTPDDQAWAPSH